MSKVTKQFVQLNTLESIDANDAEWVSEVRNSVGDNGYWVADDGDSGPILKQFAAGELVEAPSDVRVFDFISSEGEPVRFFEKDCTVYTNNGLYYVLDTPEIWEV